VPRVAAGLREQYDATPDHAVAEVERFIARCAAEGLLERAGAAGDDGLPAASAPAFRRARWAFLDAWLSLRATNRSLARSGFGPTYAALAALPRPPSDAAAPAAVAPALRAFLRAEAVCWSRRAPNDCLARSLALYRFLVNRGLAATHRIGVRHAPFLAHAWVEHDGRPLLETSAVTTQFAVIAEL
jgi:hypothetical protein